MQSLRPHSESSEDLVQRFYAELRAIAARELKRERRGHTLQPTALVHEAWARLAGDPSAPADPHAFLAAAATAMRRILVEHARARGREKRGGAWKRVELDTGLASAPDAVLDLSALDDALVELGQLDARKVQVFEMRVFAGLTVEESARALGVSEPTVKRDFEFGKAWLSARLWDRER